MESLSNEMFHLIVDELCRLHEREGRLPDNKSSLPTYSTISRQWQHAIEARTMARLTVQSDSTGFARFTDIYSHPRRRAALKRIRYEIRAPTAGISDEDYEQNEAAFVKAIFTMWNELHKWEQEDPSENLPPIVLIMECMPQEMDSFYTLAKSFRFFTLKRHSLAGLPSLRRVQEFHRSPVFTPGEHPDHLSSLAASVSRIEVLDIFYLDLKHKMRPERKSARDGFAKAILGFKETLPHLRKLVIMREGGYDPWNHSYECQNFEDEDGVDLLCEAIRLLAQAGTLQELKLQSILVSSDLFRNRRLPAGEEDTAEYPSLKRFEIRAGGLLPSGRWYFTGDPDRDDEDVSLCYPSDIDEYSEFGEGDTNEDFYDDREFRTTHPNNDRIPQHFWRTELDLETIDPLVTDVASAVLRMPRLQTGEFCVEVDPNRVSLELFATDAGYKTPGYMGKKYLSSHETRQLVIFSWNASQWEIPDSAMSKFERWAGTGKVKRERETVG